MRKVLNIILVVVTLSMISLFVTNLIGVKNLQFIEEPNDYKTLFSSSKNLQYYKTVKTEKTFPYSTYYYDDPNYGIVIFKVKSELDDLTESVKILNKKKSINSGKGYTGIISDKVKYKLNDISAREIIIYVEGFANSTFQRSSKRNLLYFSYPLYSKVSIAFNDGQQIIFEATKIPSKLEEYNELLIKKEGDYLYFVYLKPLKPLENQEREILRKLIKF